MNETIDLKISGASTMPGGEYAGVSISGAGKIQGNLRCARLHCSGAAKISGRCGLHGRDPQQRCRQGRRKRPVREPVLLRCIQRQLRIDRPDACVQLWLCAGSTAAHGRRDPQHRLSGSRARPLPGVHQLRLMQDLRRSGSGDGCFDRCGRDWRTSECRNR